MNSLFVSRIHYLFGKFTMNLLRVLRLTMDFRTITMNSLFFSRIYYEFIVFLANLVRNQLIFLIHYDFSLCFAYILIYYLLSEFSMNSICISLIFYEFPIFFLNSLWICYIFREFTMNSLFFSRIHHTPHSLSIADPVRIHFRLREFIILHILCLSRFQ